MKTLGTILPSADQASRAGQLLKVYSAALAFSVLFGSFLVNPAQAETLQIVVPRVDNSPIQSLTQVVEPPVVSTPTDVREQALVTLSASSWAPALALDSRLAGTSSFQSVGLPSLALSYSGSPWARGSWGALNFQIGLGYSLFQRQINIQTIAGSPSESAAQDMSWINLRAGLEFQPQVLSTRWLSTRLGLFLVPALASAPRSDFDDGFFLPALPLELSLGVQASGGVIGPSLSRVSVYAGAMLTEGAMPDSNLGGSGWLNLFGAGVRGGVSYGL